MACPPPDNTAMGKLVGLWPPPPTPKGARVSQKIGDKSCNLQTGKYNVLTVG